MNNKYISTIDTNAREFLKACQALQKAENLKVSKEVVTGTFANSNFDYNVLAAFYAAFINHAISNQKVNIDSLVDDPSETVECFALKTKVIGSEVQGIAEEVLKELSLNPDFENYLRKLHECIIGSFVYSKTVESGYSHDMYEREEYIYDRMHQMAKQNFTKEHKIEIPYMYIFMWSFESYARKELRRSGALQYCEENSKKAIMCMGDILTTIAVESTNVMNGIYLIGSAEDVAKHKQEDKHVIAVDFAMMLPNFKYSDEEIKVRTDSDRKKLLARIPFISCIEKSFVKETNITLVKLLKKSVELEMANKKLQEAVNLKDSIVQDFSHTYGNMKSTSLYEIAQTLMNSEGIENRRMGRKLLIEYGIKQGLTKEVYLMRLKFEKDINKLHQILQDSISPKGSNESEGTIDIINAAFQSCLLRVFYDASDREAESVREQLRSITKNLTQKRDEYENDVLINQNSAINWLNQKMFSIQISIQDGWNNLSVYRDSYSSILLRDLFSELIFNLFKYGDKRKDINMHFYEDTSKEGFLALRVENTTLTERKSKSGVGLNSKREILKLVNQTSNDEDENAECMFIEDDQERFSVRVFLNKDRFISEGEQHGL